MSAFWQSCVDVCLDALFPPRCLHCHAPDGWLCATCLAQLFLYRHNRCPQCGGVLKGDHLCNGEWPFASLNVCAAYGDPLMRELVTAFKYRSARCLVPVWRQVLARYRDERMESWPWAGASTLIVTSVPGDRKRMRERGMDHAALLADAVRDTIVPWATRSSLLRRRRSVEPNAHLPTNAARQTNVHQLFEATAQIGDSVLLVDDVITTGATMQECVHVLLAAGAPRVHVLTLARGA